MRILVCGGRDYNDPVTFADVMNKFDEITEIISGMARGADQMAYNYAKACRIPFRGFPANWSQYGLSAGYIRNMEMAESKPDLVVAFPGGKGTKNMVDIAKEKNIPVLEIESS